MRLIYLPNYPVNGIINANLKRFVSSSSVSRKSFSTTSGWLRTVTAPSGVHISGESDGWFGLSYGGQGRFFSSFTISIGDREEAASQAEGVFITSLEKVLLFNLRPRNETVTLLR